LFAKKYPQTPNGTGDCGYFFEGKFVHLLKISAQKNSAMTALFTIIGKFKDTLWTDTIYLQ